MVPSTISPSMAGMEELVVPFMACNGMVQFTFSETGIVSMDTTQLCKTYYGAGAEVPIKQQFESLFSSSARIRDIEMIFTDGSVGGVVG